MHQSFMSDHSCHTCRCSGMKARTCRTSRVHKLSDTKRKQLAGRTVRSCIPASSMPCHVHRNLSTSTYQGIHFGSQSCSSLLLYTVLTAAYDKSDALSYPVHRNWRQRVAEERLHDTCSHIYIHAQSHQRTASRYLQSHIHTCTKSSQN